MARFLVINGDDFGYSPAINAAVARSYAASGLTSTSRLVNGAAARAAYRLARTLPGLGVGWHVNLTEGGPVLPPRAVPSLVDRRELFRPLGAQLRGILTGTTPTDELARVLPLVLDLMARHRIGALRSPRLGVWLTPGAAGQIEHPWTGLRPGSALAGVVGSRGLAGNLRRLASRLDRPRAVDVARRGIVEADQLYDAAHFLNAADPPAALAAALAAGGGTVMEIMTHPA